MYESPIQLTSNVRTEVDNEIFKAIVEHNVNVDKDELIKALRYDRDQYDKGYTDGVKDFARELKNCFTISKEYLDIINIIDSLVKELAGDKL